MVSHSACERNSGTYHVRNHGDGERVGREPHDKVRDSCGEVQRTGLDQDAHDESEMERPCARFRAPRDEVYAAHYHDYMVEYEILVRWRLAGDTHMLHNRSTGWLTPKMVLISFLARLTY